MGRKYILFIIGLLAAVSCTTFKEADINDSVFNLSEDRLEWDSSANSGTVTLTSAKKWTITQDSNWVTIKQPTVKANNPFQWTITFSAEKNDEYNRTETISFGNESGKYLALIISQKGKKIAVQNVSLKPSQLTLGVGESSQIEVSIVPSNAYDKSVSWRIGDQSIASLVSKNNNYCTVKGLKEGNTTITVASNEGDRRATCEITVKKLISFADPDVEVICVTNWDKDGDGKLSETEAVAVKSLGTVFYGKTNIKTFDELRFFTGLKTIDKNAFYNCTALTSITLPEGLTGIGDYAFRRCSALKTVNIPSDVQTLGEGVFAGCSSMVNFTGKFVDSSSDRALVANKTLVAFAPSGRTSYTVPSSATKIGGYVFYDCTKLTSLTLPSSLTTIGQYAFANCTGLQSIEFLATTPPSAGSYMFDNTNCDIFVPVASQSSYIKNWSSWSSRIYSKVNGYVVVDLGLSVKWATCNVGATKPEEYGSYFAWGETKTKSTYDWSNNTWCKGRYDSFTKYNTLSSYGSFVDNKTVLDLSDDAARANWGGSWRMPTDSEWTDLIDNCTWTWTTVNGVYGRKMTSKKSGYTNKYIFLPASGYRYYETPSNAGSYGYYWSSSLKKDNPYHAWYMDLFKNNVYLSYDSRYRGFSVRPVMK